MAYKDEYLIPLMKIPSNFVFLSFYKVRTKTVLKFLNILISLIQEQSEKVAKSGITQKSFKSNHIFWEPLVMTLKEFNVIKFSVYKT